MRLRDLAAVLLALPRVSRIAVTRLKPTDVIVIETADKLSDAQKAWISNTVRLVWPNNKVAVLDGKLSIRVVAGS